MEYRDKPKELHKATCTDCGKDCEVPFEPTEGKPVRCSDCFRKNRPQRSFGGDNRSFGGNRRFGGDNRRFDRDRGPKEMHKATCSDCGKDCEVPFKPTEGKKVRCSECFEKYKPKGSFGGGNRSFGGRNSGGRSSGGNRRF